MLWWEWRARSGPLSGLYRFAGIPVWYIGPLPQSTGPLPGRRYPGGPSPVSGPPGLKAGKFGPNKERASSLTFPPY